MLDIFASDLPTPPPSPPGEPMPPPIPVEDPVGDPPPGQPPLNSAAALANYRFVGSDPRDKPLPTDPQHDQWSDRPAEDPGEDGSVPANEDEPTDPAAQDLTPLPLDQPPKPDAPNPQTDGPLS